MRKVMVLDWSPLLTEELQASLPEFLFSRRRTADEIAGTGLAAVVVATPQPLSDLSALLVHPELADVPIVVVAMGRQIPHGKSYPDVHVVHAFADQSDVVARALRRIVEARPSVAPATMRTETREPVEV
jgi:hypothetical protein